MKVSRFFIVSVTKIGQISSDCHIYQMIDYDALKNIITFIIYELVFEKAKTKDFSEQRAFCVINKSPQGHGKCSRKAWHRML